MGKLESLRFSSIENQAELVAFNQDCHKDFLEVGAYPAMVDANLYGRAWGNYPEKNKWFKQILDPNDLAFPVE